MGASGLTGTSITSRLLPLETTTSKHKITLYRAHPTKRESKTENNQDSFKESSKEDKEKGIWKELATSFLEKHQWYGYLS